MATLKITYTNNRTERVQFKTLWAANIKAQDWMAQNPNISVIDMIDNGVLHTTFRRKG